MFEIYRNLESIKFSMRKISMFFARVGSLNFNLIYLQGMNVLWVKYELYTKLQQVTKLD